MWAFFSAVLNACVITNIMIVLIHTICHVIAELSLPAWQKEVRYITYEVIEAMKEAKKYETSV